ncbi:hypothetical protein CCICO_09480 [Corynebacterium ciconiae DSM 44920]|uniref:hypothetical protein n=1 Tax=Corynebacterium ciconiae TaxID=227319 RepID=UPI000379B64A|nr:hypothetical protein [Corynebacterium ciconiae]WKD61904.1 hypothetical protein CCICO_09480 [Corynebacterium ciconiae DSM 44920]
MRWIPLATAVGVLITGAIAVLGEARGAIIAAVLAGGCALCGVWAVAQLRVARGMLFGYTAAALLAMSALAVALGVEGTMSLIARVIGALAAGALCVLAAGLAVYRPRRLRR